MKNIAIIPARGGSKRIPRKNIKPFMGKPTIAYSIEAALQSGLVVEVLYGRKPQCQRPDQLQRRYEQEVCQHLIKQQKKQKHPPL